MIKKATSVLMECKYPITSMWNELNFCIKIKTFIKSYVKTFTTIFKCDSLCGSQDTFTITIILNEKIIN